MIRTAAIALGQLGDPSAIPPLKAIVQKRLWLFRERREACGEAAAWAVAKLEGTEVGAPPSLSMVRGLDAKRTSFLRRQT